MRPLSGLSLLLILACDPATATPAQMESAADRASRRVKGLEARPDGSFIYDPGDETFSAVVYPTGEVAFRDWGQAGFGELGVRVSGPTEWAARAGKEAQHAREKAEFLQRSVHERSQLAAAHLASLGEMVLSDLPARLESLSVELQDDPPALRKRIFELWDECLEGRPDADASQLDRTRRAQGAEARRRIEAFVREHLPQGSPLGYSKEELDALNAGRASSAAFRPY